MVCRLGGDEFALLIEGKSGLPVEPLARRIDEAIRHPADPREMVEGLGCCMGIASYPRHGQDAEALISQADIALYSLKRAGNGGFCTADAIGSRVAEA